MPWVFTEHLFFYFAVLWTLNVQTARNTLCLRTRQKCKLSVTLTYKCLRWVIECGHWVTSLKYFHDVNTRKAPGGWSNTGHGSVGWNTPRESGAAPTTGGWCTTYRDVINKFPTVMSLINAQLGINLSRLNYPRSPRDLDYTTGLNYPHLPCVPDYTARGSSCRDSPKCNATTNNNNFHVGSTLTCSERGPILYVRIWRIKIHPWPERINI